MKYTGVAYFERPAPAIILAEETGAEVAANPERNQWAVGRFGDKEFEELLSIGWEIVA